MAETVSLKKIAKNERAGIKTRMCYDCGCFEIEILGLFNLFGFFPVNPDSQCKDARRSELPFSRPHYLFASALRQS